MDVLLNLAAAVIGAVAVQTWRSARTRYRFRTSRAFWKPLLAAPSRVIICEFLGDDVRNNEPAGLTGLAELRSLMSLMSVFSESGLTRDLKVETPSGVEKAAFLENLIILGGPDVNSATRQMLDEAGCTFRVEQEDKRNVIHDVSKDGTRVLRPEHDIVRISGQPADDIKDYGIVVRMPNPLNRRSQILVLAGVYGYGVIAAEQVCRTKAAELLGYVSRYPLGFECLVSIPVLAGQPGVARIEEVRELLVRRPAVS